MSKRNKQKTKQKAKPQRTTVRQGRAQQQGQFVQAAMQASELIEAGDAFEAIAILEPLLEQYPNATELYGLAASAYLQIGDAWAAMAAFEQVQKSNQDPMIWAALTSVYLAVGMPMYAVQASRRMPKADMDAEDLAVIGEAIQGAVQEITTAIQESSVSTTQGETGLRHYDDAYRALHFTDYQASVDASRRAIRFLGKWPPAHNMLAVALFFQGKPAEALATIKNVLADAPDNIQALSNAIRFLAWSDKLSEAAPLWEHLHGLEATNDHDRLKMAEAAAIMQEDETVYQLLKPVVDKEAITDAELSWMALYRLAIAEANTKRIKSALKHLEEYAENLELVAPLVEALKQDRPGLGLSKRYSYFNVAEMLPITGFDALMDLMDQMETMDQRLYRAQVSRLVERYPQTILVGKRLIWEENQAQTGIKILGALGTPSAIAALREFAFGREGEDSDRVYALLVLIDIDAISPDERVRMWIEGEWQEDEANAFDWEMDETEDDEEIDNLNLSPEAIDLMDQGENAYNSQDYAEAERLFRQVIELEPAAYPAYFNLGTTLAMLDDPGQAKAMYRKVLELTPNHAYARLNLANYLIDEDDIPAQELILPLENASWADVKPQSIYMFVQARIFLKEGKLEDVITRLTDLLEADPTFLPAIDMLEKIEKLLGKQDAVGNAPKGRQQRRKR